MDAILWIYDKKCRVLLKDGDQVLDLNDTWNNRASAESMVLRSFPEANIQFVHDPNKIDVLNAEWDVLTKGIQ